MKSKNNHSFSGFVTVFHERRLPVVAIPAGYAALIEAYSLAVPLPRILSATGKRHTIISEDNWRILTPRHAPDTTLESHLTFALKHEGVDLLVLKKLFEATGAKAVEEMVKGRPTGAYARRLWFLYEWLLDTRLDLPDADTGSYVLVLDVEQQYAGDTNNSRRHRVKNNLPGTPTFCPLVFRTDRLERFIAKDLPARARDIIAKLPGDVLSRAAAFLLLQDSKSSYAIEGERAPQERIQRWGRAIGEAGARSLDLDELLRLQRIVIGDARFVALGLREEGGFVGEHDREFRAPLPNHISARPDDLESLSDGLCAFDHGASKHLDPVIAAAVLAFGFIYIHPFVDGNGRIHRYLIHHMLVQRGFNPPGMVFPISAAILDDIYAYRAILESYSAPLLLLIEWKGTEDGNVNVLNDTVDYYRYFDATLHAEFLYNCVAKTIEEDLPKEAAFLQHYDQFRARVETIVDMPDRTTDLLFRFLAQNNGALSVRARNKEFKLLKDNETRAIEEAYRCCFVDTNETRI
jgi:Fic family protein